MGGKGDLKQKHISLPYHVVCQSYDLGMLLLAVYKDYWIAVKTDLAAIRMSLCMAAMWHAAAHQHSFLCVTVR